MSDTEVIAVDADRPDPEAVERAAGILRRGGLVAIPTETVYGLGADALDESAVAKIFEAKDRPPTNPLIVHVESVDRARRLAAGWPDAAGRLADAFWPGPLTLVVRRAAVVPDAVCAGLETVAIRMPSHPVARALIEAADTPLAAPSANRHTELSPTTADHVLSGLDGRIDAVVDAGPTRVGVESTLVSVVEDPAEILRPGMIGFDQLRDVVDVRPFRSRQVDDSTPRPSPGMSKRHYSPSAPLRLVDGEAFERLLVEEDERRGFVGVKRRSPADDEARVEWLSDDPERYARGLYAALHRLDDAGVVEIVVERPPDERRWEAVRDRLRRATTPRTP